MLSKFLAKQLGHPSGLVGRLVAAPVLNKRNSALNDESELEAQRCPGKLGLSPVFEVDLYDQPGRYSRLVGEHMQGKPCPACGTAIEKLSVLGGSVYVCPSCQE